MNIYWSILCSLLNFYCYGLESVSKLALYTAKTIFRIGHVTTIGDSFFVPHLLCA